MKKTLCVILGLTVAGAIGCDSDDGPTTVDVAPQAKVRYINASPDSPALEAVFVDKVENSYTFRRVAFRASTGEYQAVNVGTRNLRVFRALNAVTPQGTIDTAQVVVLDTTFALQADVRYTILQYGNALAAAGGAAAARVVVFQDTLPESVAAGSIAIRTYHALAGTGNVTVTISPRTTAGTGAAVATASNIPFLGRSAYATVPALPVADTSGYYRFRVTAAGAPTAAVDTFPTTFSLVANQAATASTSSAGTALVAATPTSPAQPATAGFRQGGSVISAIVVPAIVGTASSRPTVIIVPDRPPPTP